MDKMMNCVSVKIIMSQAVKDAAHKKFGPNIKCSCMRIYDDSEIFVLECAAGMLRFFDICIASKGAIRLNKKYAGYKEGDTVLIEIEGDEEYIGWFSDCFNAYIRAENEYYEKIRVVELSGLAGCVGLNKDVAGVIKGMVVRLCAV